MSLLKSFQLPLSINAKRKRQARSQFACLPYRIKKGKVEVLLVTSRRTGRWILPKGWPENGKTPAQSAAQEAYEEAGVKGQSYEYCLGVYSYIKQRAGLMYVPVVGMVYPMKVTQILDKYPEQKMRKRKWMSRKKAASKLTEPELQQIVRKFDPAWIKQRMH